MEGTFPNIPHNGPLDGAGAYTPIAWQATAHTNVTLPTGEDFLRADFVRAGSDLLMETPAGGHFVISDYFLAPSPPALETAEGAVLSADVVMHLAGPLAPAMVAQTAAIEFSGLGEPIGQLSEGEGSVTITHADGTKVALSVGDDIYQGDVLETGVESSAAIVFIDDTIFTLDGDGRMIMDEMVYDPDTQIGVFNAQVVQGVFSFVSGKVAKTSPEGMVISTPTNTIGIRGSTVLGRAAAEGSENKITLVTDVNGNVGEIIISNAFGSTVLNQAGATTTVFSANGAPSQVIFLSPQQIQQDFGSSLTNLIKTVAKQATHKAEQAQQKAQETQQEADQVQQESQQAQDEADQAGQAAADADVEAEAAQIEADALAAEAEAAKAEALGNPEAEATAKALEVKAAEAEAKAVTVKAQADAAAVKAAAAATQAEGAAAKAATMEQQAADAAFQADQHMQFSQMAGTAAVAQEQVFTQFMETGFVDPTFVPGAPPPGGFDPNAPPPDQGPGDGKAGTADTVTDPDDAAAKAAYEEALAAGATPEEAFNAAAMAASDGNMDDPAVAAARAAYEEALAAGASPEDALLAAQSAANQFDFQQGGQVGPGAPPPPGSYDPMTYDPMMGTTYDPMMGGTYDPMYDPMMSGMYDPMMGGMYDPMFDPMMGDIYDPLAFDPYFGGQYDYYDPFYDPNLTHAFGETIFAPPGGGVMAGTALNTNFFFHWGSIASGAAYTISDSGGTNQIAFDSLNNMTAKVTFATATSGDIIISNNMTGSGSYATVDFSNINQFLLSDVSVAGFAYADNFTEGAGGDVLVLGAMEAADVGFVIAGTDNAETIDLINANTNFASLDGAIVFAKGGGDTINIDIITGELTVIGGITATDNVLANNADLLPDSGLNTFNLTNTYASGSGLRVIMNGDGGPSGDAHVYDRATPIGSTPAFHHDLWDVGVFIASKANDLINVNSGYYNALNAGTGNDTVTIGSNAYLYTVNMGAGDDTLNIDSNLLTTATGAGAIQGGGNASDILNVQAHSGGTIDLSANNIAGFTAINFTAANSASSVNVTSGSVTTSLIGSGYDDTLVGGSAVDTITGGAGADTLTGAASADIFKYMSASQSMAGAGTRDTITDFVTTADKIDIAALVGGGSFQFQALSSASGVTVQAFMSGNILQFDTTDDGVADMEIDLSGVTAAVGDFVIA